LELPDLEVSMVWVMLSDYGGMDVQFLAVDGPEKLFLGDFRHAFGLVWGVHGFSLEGGDPMG
jgi:hypothetical protein